MTADETIDATGKLRHPGRHRRPHPHGAAVRRDVRQGHVRDRDARRGVRRDDHRSSTSPSSRKGQSLREGLDAWHAKAEGNAVADYGFHMIMSDVNDDTLEEMDGARRRGRPRLQAVHRLPGRLLQRRRGDLPGDAADRQERRADHDARRERDGHRRRRRADRRGRARPIRSATGWPARPSSRARRPTASSASPRRPACRSTSSTCRPREALAEVRAARDRGTKVVRRDVPAVPVPVARRPRQRVRGRQVRLLAAAPPKDHWDDLWTGLVKDDLQLVATDHCPFDFHGQKELGRGDFRKVPNGLPGVEDRVDLLHDGGVVGGRITQERWVEIISTAPAKMFGMYPQKGAIAVGVGRGHRRLRPEPRSARSRRATHHMDVDYSCYEGRVVQGAQRRRPVARLGRRPRRRVHRAEGPRPVHQACPGRLRPDAERAPSTGTGR